MLYKHFVKKTVLKYGGLADFSTTCLQTMLVYMHAHHHIILLQLLKS